VKFLQVMNIVTHKLTPGQLEPVFGKPQVFFVCFFFCFCLFAVVVFSSLMRFRYVERQSFTVASCLL